MIIISKIFTTRTYNWNQVVSVSLSSQESFPYLLVFSYNLNAMKLTFTGDRVLKVWTEKYSNLTELRAYAIHKLNKNLQLLPERKSQRRMPFLQKKIFR